ncbi:MAG TPA: hypothetical protein PKE69_06775 [Pyrinomonadaceae bacterium]|nr:hypothetical protein [Pyrinomonadaceae bacterium]
MNQSSYFHAKIYRGSCYGSKAWGIEFSFGADGAFSAEISDWFQKKAFVPEREKLEKYLLQIFEIIAKEEVLSDLRHVETSYHAEIEWQNMDFLATETPSGKLKTMSNEWHLDQIEEAISESETTEIAARYQKNLDSKPHRHALEIYVATMKFTTKYQMELF